MLEREILRYSEVFKRQLVSELENGRFNSIAQARKHYGITGKSTIKSWLSRYGLNHLQAKVVRVEKPEEADRFNELKKKVASLERALGQTQAENLLNAEFLRMACQKLGEDVETFKKKRDGKPSKG